MVGDLRSLGFAEYVDWMARLGQPKYRAAQIFRWVHREGVASFDQMTDLSLEFRRRLADEAAISDLRIRKLRQSDAGQTVKLLLALEDGQHIETVLMQYRRSTTRDRVTVCASTQVGCSMGCRFCATGAGGLVRNLTSGEIVGQVYTCNRLLAKAKGNQKKVTNVVFMGMGEPLVNYRATVKAVRLLCDPRGLHISPRRITISTCGVVPGIKRLALEGLPITLAISLHAPEDSLRNRLVPINRRYHLQSLMQACRDYVQKTNRRITFEYTLIRGINDSPAMAHQLAELVRGLLANVNLIPLNAAVNDGYAPPTPVQTKQFAEILLRQGVNATIRESRGGAIAAACGQLRATSCCN